MKGCLRIGLQMVYVLDIWPQARQVEAQNEPAGHILLVPFHCLVKGGDDWGSSQVAKLMA